MTDIALPTQKAVKPDEIRVRLQPKSFSRGLKKTPNDQPVPPRIRVNEKQAATTNQP